MGATSLAYCPRNELLISGGKKGDITVHDIRQRTIVNTFQAHESAIRTLSINLENGSLISGGTDGDVKVRLSFLVCFVHVQPLNIQL